MVKEMIALDLFAGTGWGVACQRLGIKEYGVEIMPEAVATREANGMSTLYRDVWEGLQTDPDDLPPLGDYDILIASPPCQTFSMAGAGAGRKALDEVLDHIRSGAYRDVAKLRAFGEAHDPRTALVLTPLVHVFRDAPRFVVFEQVPPVLPVWEACAEEMRKWGYSVWTGNLQAEMYGVPQTRKRAVLIALADGREAKPPTPTHSRYYSRDPQRLDEGVLPWVSMAEALGWCGRQSHWVVTGGATTEMYQPRSVEVPGPPVTGAGNMFHGVGERFTRDLETGLKAKTTNAECVTVAEAATLQSYPPGFEWRGTKTKQYLQVGNAVPPLLAEAILREVMSRG